jgi:hypothetical protein
MNEPIGSIRRYSGVRSAHFSDAVVVICSYGPGGPAILATPMHAINRLRAFWFRCTNEAPTYCDGFGVKWSARPLGAKSPIYTGLVPI